MPFILYKKKKHNNNNLRLKSPKHRNQSKSLTRETTKLEERNHYQLGLVKIKTKIYTKTSQEMIGNQQYSST